MSGFLLGSAILVLPIASALTVLAYLADVSVPGLDLPFNNPVNAALAAATVVWFIAAALVGRYVGPRSVNRSSYSLLEPRVGRLQLRIDEFCASPTGACKEACREARDQHRWLTEHVTNINRADRETDSEIGWVTGFSYIDSWRRLHRAEEALLMCEPKDSLIGYAKEDYLRLKGSGISNEKELLKNLFVAVRAIDEKSLTYFPKDDWKDLDTHNGPSNETGARSVLITVRRSVNEYRDGSHAGVVNARNVLALSAIATSVIGYAILVLAVESAAPKSAVVTATAFFLAGALGGLLDRIRSDAKAETTVDDYGLSLIRIIQTPIVAGLAGIAGVLIGEFLSSALSSQKAASTVSLGDLFDVLTHPTRLVVAAVFGTTPSLVSNVLTKKADQYLKQIADSTTANGSDSSQGNR